MLGCSSLGENVEFLKVEGFLTFGFFGSGSGFRVQRCGIRSMSDVNIEEC